MPYMYDNRYGIDVNSILLGGAIGVDGVPPPPQRIHYSPLRPPLAAVASAYANGPKSKCGTPNAFGGLYPACAPWNFRPGLVIRDNWVAQVRGRADEFGA